MRCTGTKKGKYARGSRSEVEIHNKGKTGRTTVMNYQVIFQTMYVDNTQGDKGDSTPPTHVLWPARLTNSTSQSSAP